MSTVKGPTSTNLTPTADYPSGRSSVASPSSGDKNVSDSYKQGPQKIPNSKLSSPRSSSVMGAKLFAGEVSFSPNLLSPTDPKNNRKYLKLMGAVFGFDELDDCLKEFEEDLKAEKEKVNEEGKENDQNGSGGSDEEDREGSEGKKSRK